MVTKIANGIVITDGKQVKTNVYYSDGKITALTSENLPCDEEVDAGGRYVTAGFIDIHTHGAGGYDFLDNTEEAFVNSAIMHAKHGATAIVPTVTSSTTESMLGGKKDGLKVIIEDGVAKLPDRSAFAGSVALCDRLIRTAVNIAGIPIEDAVVMATRTPAAILNIKNKGDIIPGYDADIVIFDDDINICRTIIGGRVVYSL